MISKAWPSGVVDGLHHCDSSSTTPASVFSPRYTGITTETVCRYVSGPFVARLSTLGEATVAGGGSGVHPAS